MNTLKITAAALTSWLAMGLYSAPTFAAMIGASGADFQYGLGEAGITTANNRHVNANATDASTSTFRSLGSKGAAVFSFDSAFSGTVTIWETTFNTCTDNGLSFPRFFVFQGQGFFHTYFPPSTACWRQRPSNMA